VDNPFIDGVEPIPVASFQVNQKLVDALWKYADVTNITCLKNP